MYADKKPDKKRFLSMTMIKVIIFLLPLVFLFPLFGCEQREEPDLPITHTVTFIQDGYDDIIKEVEKGQALTDIPAPRNDRVGFTASWDKTDFSSITEDTRVFAKYDRNIYKVYYDCSDSEINTIGLEFDETLEMYYQFVTYDDSYALLTPSKPDYTFLGFMNKETGATVYSFGDKWKTTSNVIITPTYIETSELYYTVNFYYGENYENQLTITKLYGEYIDPIADGVPDFPATEGYYFGWEDVSHNEVNISELNENINVYGKMLPKKFFIHYSSGTKEDGTEYKMQYLNIKLITSYDQEVAFDKEFYLISPGGYGYNFVRWIDKSTGEEYKRPKDGIWNYTEDLYLEAVWVVDTSGWSGYY